MVPSRRSAFTLIELLVVIMIIGLLLAMLLPAINISRDGGRRVDCLNRVRNLAMASELFNTQFNHLPGYNMSSGTTNSGVKGNYRTSWVLMLTPFIEKNDIWANWSSPTSGGPASAAAAVYWDQVVCPSNPPLSTSGPILSYVINAGRPDDGGTPPDLAANGVAFNLFDTLGDPAAQVRVSIESLEAGKGASYTLLVSENTIPGLTWAPGSKITSKLVGNNYELMCAFNWQMTTTPSAAQMINGDRSNVNPPAAGCAATDYARPASNHIGGVNAAFADSHCQFIQEGIDYSVFQALMVSDPTKPDASTYVGSYVLHDSDYK